MRIWIEQKSRNITPSHNQKNFKPIKKSETLNLVVSDDGKVDYLVINQDENIYVGRLSKDKDISFEANNARRYWLKLVFGQLDVENYKLVDSDAIIVSEEDGFKISTQAF